MKKTSILLSFFLLLFSTLKTFAQTSEPGLSGAFSTDPKFLVSNYRHVVVSLGGNSNGILAKSTSEYSTIDVDAPSTQEAFVRLGKGGSATWGIKNGFGTNNDFSIFEYSNGNKLTIKKSTGLVGIGISEPTAKLHVSHDTQGLDSSPQLRLTQTADASFGRIRMENSDGTKYFMQKFDLSGTVPDDYNINWEYNAIDIFNVNGNGNATHNGFTKLGGSAPGIKVMKLTGTTSSSQGGAVNISHGLNSSKILSITVLVEHLTGSFVHHSYTDQSGYNFNFAIGSTNIVVYNSATSSGSILNKPIKIMITYEE